MTSDARRRKAAYRKGVLDGKASAAIEDAETINAVIRRIAEVASGVGFQAGEPAMEFAGQIVSVLAIHPEHTERFLAEGVALFLDGTLNVENGCLPYRARNGAIVSPSELRKRMGTEQ